MPCFTSSSNRTSGASRGGTGAISSSRRSVTSLGASLPPSTITLMPLYCGGLWEAVTIMPIARPSWCTAYISIGVGATSSINHTGIPSWAKISANARENRPDKNRRSCPITTGLWACLSSRRYWAAPFATRRTLLNVKSSAITARQPPVPNLIMDFIPSSEQSLLVPVVDSPFSAGFLFAKSRGAPARLAVY